MDSWHFSGCRKWHKVSTKSFFHHCTYSHFCRQHVYIIAICSPDWWLLTFSDSYSSSAPRAFLNSASSCNAEESQAMKWQHLKHLTCPIQAGGKVVGCSTLALARWNCSSLFSSSSRSDCFSCSISVRRFCSLRVKEVSMPLVTSW